MRVCVNIENTNETALKFLLLLLWLTQKQTCLRHQNDLNWPFVQIIFPYMQVPLHV